MKLKNSKGITLVSLIIIIIVMLVLASIAVYSGTGIIQEAKVEDTKTNMLLVQAKIKNYVEQAKFEKKEDINGITIDDVTLSITASPEVEGYYKIEDMSSINLPDLNSEDYLISYNIENIDVDVYFVPGIEDSDGNTYHKLSEVK